MSIIRLKDPTNDIRHLTEGPDQRRLTSNLKKKYMYQTGNR